MGSIKGTIESDSDVFVNWYKHISIFKHGMVVKIKVGLQDVMILESLVSFVINFSQLKSATILWRVHPFDIFLGGGKSHVTSTKWHSTCISLGGSEGLRRKNSQELFLQGNFSSRGPSCSSNQHGRPGCHFGVECARGILLFYRMAPTSWSVQDMSCSKLLTE